MMSRKAVLKIPGETRPALVSEAGLHGGVAGRMRCARQACEKPTPNCSTGSGNGGEIATAAAILGMRICYSGLHPGFSTECGESIVLASMRLWRVIHDGNPGNERRWRAAVAGGRVARGCATGDGRGRLRSVSQGLRPGYLLPPLRGWIRRMGVKSGRRARAPAATPGPVPLKPTGLEWATARV